MSLELITPEATPAENDSSVEDDSILSTVGGEIAADAIEDLGDVTSDDFSDDDSIIPDEVEVIDDESGDNITSEIKDAVSDAEDSVVDVGVSEDDAIIDVDSGVELVIPKADVPDDDSDDDEDDDDISLDSSDLSDIDPDDIVGGAFDDDDAIIMDTDTSEFGDIAEDLDDLIESVIQEGTVSKKTKRDKSVPLDDDDENLSAIDDTLLGKKKSLNEDDSDSILDSLD